MSIFLGLLGRQYAIALTSNVTRECTLRTLGDQTNKEESTYCMIEPRYLYSRPGVMNFIY
jgi:hypothetical protein